MNPAVKMILKGADAWCLVADSQDERLDEIAEQGKSAGALEQTNNEFHDVFRTADAEQTRRAECQ